MAKRPKKPDHEDSQDKGLRGQSLGRRAFVKLVGSTGVAVSATSVLGGAAILPGIAEAAPGDLVGPGALPITLRINGQTHKVTLEPRVTLLDALRNHLDLTGAKKVCDRGTCGACTVHMNGKAVYSCTVLAIDAAGSGADIRTIESLSPEGQLHPLSASFVENDAQQCGFCTPGFVMASKAYLDSHPHPTYDEVRAALGGNLCRCGTYMGVRRAVVAAGSGTTVSKKEGA